MTDLRSPVREPLDAEAVSDLVRRARAGERLAISRIVTELERASAAMPWLDRKSVV